MNNRLDVRPPLATAVGMIGIVAGILPILEVGAVLWSARFAAWFLPIVHSLLPVSRSVALALLLTIGTVDIAFGYGVLRRNPLARFGMILRSLLTVPLDYLNFRAGNHIGALFGLAVSIFIVWVLLRPKIGAWFRIPVS